MERTKRLLLTIEQMISTKSKRHIVGGLLLSTSIFLGGLAITVLSAKYDDKDEYDQIYLE